MMNVLYAVLVLVGLGIVCSIIIMVFVHLFEVKKNDLVVAVRDALPGVNCGACGYPGCDEYAEAVSKREAQPNLCIPGGPSVAAKLGELLGVEVGSVEKKVALVACQGGTTNTDDKMQYDGIESCASCMEFFGGRAKCPYGCMGYGDCVDACQYDAIHIIDEVAVVQSDLCTGCGACVRTCPKNLIELVNYDLRFAAVLCKNNEKGDVTRKGCKVGCIGCKQCEKACEFDAVHVEENLAKVDYEKCTACEACVAVCPTNAILMK